MQTQKKEVATAGLSRFFATVYGYMTLELLLFTRRKVRLFLI